MRRCLSHITVSIIFFIVSIFQTHAQEGIVKGKVRSKDDVLQAATVSAGKKIVLTNEAGDFFIQLKPGTYILTISYAGYQPVSQEIKIAPGETSEFNFILETSQNLDNVVVLGSRSAIKRSSMNSPVPVDVISGQKLPKAATSLTEQLFITVPSFNSPPQTVGATASTNPATLRGLSPDQTLVLINGHRRHTTPTIVLQYGLAYGSVFTDLNCIPAAAIDNVQILRDGAAAQYGSDAIASVIDFQLKKVTGQTAINLHLGQYYKGDGETISLDINRGFRINNKGFINFTIASRFNKPTQRNGVYTGTVYSNNVTIDDSIIMARGFDRLNHRRIGLPQISNSSVILNGGYSLTQKTNLFFTATFNYRYTRDFGSNLYRYPKDTSLVITQLYPDGFLIKVLSTTPSSSLIAGIESNTKNGWRWDISTTLGTNSSHSIVVNSNNASQYALGKNAQTSFDPGNTIFTQSTTNVNFTKNFKKDASKFESLVLSYGGEFRIEYYGLKAGEEASYKDYAPGSGRLWGSQGIGGRSDTDVVNKFRYISAAYLELETEVNAKLLINVAGRYEYYTDFVGNLAGKLAMRYKFSEKFLLRSSISNGFRAPAIAQHYYNNISPSASRGVVSLSWLFSNDSRAARIFGLSPLRAEKSLSISGGTTSSLSKHINITLDAYWIQISNRITLTGNISKESSLAVKNILISLGKSDINNIRFFSNAISTRTKGIDLVVTGNWLIRKDVLEISLSGNYNKTTIYRVDRPAKNLPDDSLHQYTIINPEERGRLEQGQPLSKIVLVVSYKKGKWEFVGRSVYFGKVAHLFAGADRNRDEFFSPKTLAGCTIGYSPKSWLTIRAGARNIFNKYPDKIKNSANTQGGLVIYDFNGTQIGYNGGYYFVNLSFNF